MALYPAPAKVVVGSNRIVKVTISRPRAYYSRAGKIQLAQGVTDVRVPFTTPLQDADYIVGSLTIQNSADALIDIVSIVPMVRSGMQQSGFDVILTAPPPSGNYWLHWAIAEEYNP